MKKYTEEERKEARRLSVKKYNDKVKNKKKLLYAENKEEYSIKNKEYYKNNKEKIKSKVKEYADNNKEKIKESSKIYYENNRDIIKEKSAVYREKTKLTKKEYDQEYRKNNKEKINSTKSLYKKNRRLIDPSYKLKENIRRSISDSFRRGGYSKESKTTKILDCSFDEFKLYLESKFEPWMNWNNYGLYNGELNHGWDIDHVIPLCSATTKESVTKLNHYTNLQPLCSKTNRVIKKDNF